MQEIPRFAPVERRLIGEAHSKLGGQNCLRMTERVQAKVVQAGVDMGNYHGVGTKKDGLLDVGLHLPGLCDDAEGSQDAHLWRAPDWIQDEAG